ncbi:MAG: hypothetical protein AB1668_04235 [Nanoarchaeota archaeon]
MFRRNLLIMLIVLIVFLFVLPAAVAVGLSGMKLSPIIYEPGKTIVNHYTILGTDLETNVYLEGYLSKYVTLSEVSGNEFDMTIHFPDEYLPQGSYTFSMGISEVPPANAESGGISSLTSVSKTFFVEVYSLEKDIAASLQAHSVNVGKPVVFKLNVESKTYSDIDSVQGEITVFNKQNESLGKVVTKKKPLKALSSETLSAVFDTTGLLPGEYSAKAVVFYDGKQKEAGSTFKIGNMDVLIKNYTSSFRPGFNEFNVVVVNDWGDSLRNVYVKLFVEGKELLQTPSISLAPWQEGALKSLFKIDLEPGIYDGLLQVFYEGEMKEEKIKVSVFVPLTEQIPGTAEGSGSEYLFVVLMSVIFIIVFALIILAVFATKKKRKGEEI